MVRTISFNGRRRLKPILFVQKSDSNIPSDKKSIALSVTIQSSIKTLDEQDLNQITKKIISTVEDKTGAKIRS